MDTKNQVTKPEVVNGYAQLVELDQLYLESSNQLTDNWLLKFFTDKGVYFTTIVSDAPNKNNPEIPSRLQQLRIGDKILVGDFVKLSIAQIRAHITGYLDKEGKNLIPYKEDRLEIKKIDKVSENLFLQNYKDFIASKYEKEISEKVKTGISTNDAIELYVRIHRQNANN